eukprot:COSAG02_NODE_46122_length_351_cov_1.031746_1_plen_54_part_10
MSNSSITRLQNTFHGALHLLVRRLNTIELLTAVDSDSGNSLPLLTAYFACSSQD